jgi:hypothetical protein
MLAHEDTEIGHLSISKKRKNYFRERFEIQGRPDFTKAMLRYGCVFIDASAGAHHWISLYITFGAERAAHVQDHSGLLKTKRQESGSLTAAVACFGAQDMYCS